MALAKLIIARKDHIGKARADFVAEPTTGALAIQRWQPERTVVTPNRTIPVGKDTLTMLGRSPTRFVTPVNPPVTGFPYFDSLVASQWHAASYSLRSQAQFSTFDTWQTIGGTHDVNYVYPNDPDPRKQNAAKIVLRGDGTLVKSDTNQVSIAQVRILLPTMTPGRTIMVTWDHWWGDEWRNPNHHIGAHKAFQLRAPEFNNGSTKIWVEPHHSYDTAVVNQATDICRPSIRHYASVMKLDSSDPLLTPNILPSTYWGVPHGPNVTSGQGTFTPMTPFVVFLIKPETWTRQWMLFEYQMDSQTIADYGGVLNSEFQSKNGYAAYPGTRCSMWLADENRDPVLIYNRAQITCWPPGIRDWGIEVNTSSNIEQIGFGHSDMVAYCRNMVVLDDIQFNEMPQILQRPT